MRGDVSVVLFDADGVLQHTARDWNRTLDEIGGAGFAEAVFTYEILAMRGEVSMRDRLHAAAAAHGADLDVDAALDLWRHVEMDDEAVAVVAQVRAAGSPVCLATNQQDLRRDVMRRLYAGVFDEDFYSCELGACKPDPTFFRSILDRLAVPAEQTVFVDDSPRNVAAAASCGIRALLHEPSSGALGLRLLLENAGVRI